MDIMTVPEPIEHSDVRGTARHLMEHSGDSGDWQNGRQSHADDSNTPFDVGTGEQESPSDIGETIVVGAVGSAAPWFLTGWVDGVEVEFMIDTRSRPWLRRCLSECVRLILGCDPDCVCVDAG